MPRIFKNIPKNVIVVAFVAFFSGLGQEMISPILPAFLLTLGFDRAAIGLIDGLLQGSTSFFKFISGIISDKLQNRKGLVLLGYAISSLARPFLSLASGFGSVGALRVLDGIGKGVKDAPRDALVADSVIGAKTGRAFGFHRLVDTAGSVIGPIAAAVLLYWFGSTLASYKIIFALTAIPGIIALLLIIFGVKEPRRESRNKSNGQLFKFSKIFWIFVIISFIAMFTKINDSLMLVRANELGISKVWLPILFAYFTAIYALFSYPIGIISDKRGKLPFIVLGWLTLGLAQFGLSFQINFFSILLLYTFYGLFFAFTEGSGRALIADLVGPESRGSGYAIFNTGVGLALIGGGFTFGKLWDTAGAELVFKISAVGSLVAALAFFYLFKKRGPRLDT